jgi:hypothetical protein
MIEKFYFLGYNNVPSFSLFSTPASRWFLAWLILRQWRWRYVPPKRRLTLTGLHGVISQKITELFITTGVKTSNPKIIICIGCETKWLWFNGKPLKTTRKLRQDSRNVNYALTAHMSTTSPLDTPAQHIQLSTTVSRKIFRYGEYLEK